MLVLGVCVVIIVVCCFGLLIDCFQFIGFIFVKSKVRQIFFIEVVNLGIISIMYESIYCIMVSFDDLEVVFGVEQLVVFVKELIKIFEIFFNGMVVELKQFLMDDLIKQCGEIVLMLLGKVK